MSCYWRLWCATCDETTEESHNHGEESLEALWRLREAVRAIHSISGTIYLRVEGGYDAPGFVVEHREHEVWLVSEYKERRKLEGAIMEDDIDAMAQESRGHYMQAKALHDKVLAGGIDPATIKGELVDLLQAMLALNERMMTWAQKRRLNAL